MGLSDMNNPEASISPIIERSFQIQKTTNGLCATERHSCRMTGKLESAGMNRHVVGNARALQERRTATPA